MRFNNNNEIAERTEKKKIDQKSQTKEINKN